MGLPRSFSIWHQGQPQPGKPLRWKQWLLGPMATERTDGHMGSQLCPRRVAALPGTALCTCRIVPHSLGWGDTLEGKERFTLSKLFTIILQVSFSIFSPPGPKSPLCLLSNFFIKAIFLTFNHLYCLSLNPAPYLYVFSGEKRIKRQYSRCK